MDNSENIPYDNIPDTEPQEEASFADSSYEMNTSPENSMDEPVLPFEDEPVWTVEDVPFVDSLPKKKRTGKKVLKKILSAVAVILLIAICCGITAGIVDYRWNKDRIATAQTLAELRGQIADLKEEIEDNSFTGQGNSVSGTPSAVSGLTPGQVYAKNRKSVVAVSNQVTTNIFGQISEKASSGSGFIISEDGYVVSNYHVVEGATTLTVITSDGTEYDAELIGYEEDNDLALLKIDATGLTTVQLGSSDDLIVGDQVVAIGNPLGELTNTLTVGYISAKDRDVTSDGTIINMLQTDAAINPGNSGGPLFNMKGEVIGITTAKYSGTTSSGASIEGIGFAIPMDDVAGMITELIENGYISAPYMGITITKQADGVGVYVRTVEPNSQAAAAGLKAGDIIVGLGEYEVSSVAALDKALRHFNAFDTTSIFVYRNRQVQELTITFAEKNQPAATKPLKP